MDLKDSRKAINSGAEQCDIGEIEAKFRQGVNISQTRTKLEDATIERYDGTGHIIITGLLPNNTFHLIANLRHKLNQDQRDIIIVAPPNIMVNILHLTIIYTKLNQETITRWSLG